MTDKTLAQELREAVENVKNYGSIASLIEIALRAATALDRPVSEEVSDDGVKAAIRRVALTCINARPGSSYASTTEPSMSWADWAERELLPLLRAGTQQVTVDEGMVERVAMKMVECAAREGEHGGTDWDALPIEIQDLWRKDAREVLTAALAAGRK